MRLGAFSAWLSLACLVWAGVAAAETGLYMYRGQEVFFEFDADEHAVADGFAKRGSGDELAELGFRRVKSTGAPAKYLPVKFTSGVTAVMKNRVAVRLEDGCENAADLIGFSPEKSAYNSHLYFINTLKLYHIDISAT